jgi:hypothetical protein
MNNPLEILRTLDRRLSKQTELTLFGRSALALGYPNPPQDYGATHDVDGIIPITAEEPDLDFCLTKMARGDAQDLEDIRFLLGQEAIPPRELQAAFARARVPEVEEIRQLFLLAQPKVLRLAGNRVE